jgi:ribonuclease R
MIEEFMLKANEIVAQYLDSRGKAAIFRIHEEPSQDSFKEFFEFAKGLGFELPVNPTQKDIQKLFENVKHSPYLRLLSINFIRSMKLAYYSPENIGHFGLALEHYTHFTSPIRRYSDLVVQRILFNEEAKDIDIEKITENCSEKERNAFKAESSTILLKKLRLLKKSFKNDPNKRYKAKITKVRQFGIAFELEDFFIDGFIHVEDMRSDYFEYDTKKSMLVGRNTNIKYFLATPIEVVIASLDLIKQEVKYLLTDKKFPKKRKKKKK